MGLGLALLGAFARAPLGPVDWAWGGEELCSLAPPDVSAEPDGGIVADFETSGVALCPVGGAGCSVAKAVVSPSNRIAAA